MRSADTISLYHVPHPVADPQPAPRDATRCAKCQTLMRHRRIYTPQPPRTDLPRARHLISPTAPYDFRRYAKLPPSCDAPTIGFISHNGCLLAVRSCRVREISDGGALQVRGS